MRKRLHIKFKSVKGSEFVSDFFDEETGKVHLESVVESIYNNKTLIASNGNIEIVKLGWSDGLMNFKYLKDNPVFYGYQEVKRNVKLTDIQLKKQLLQALYYRNKSPKKIKSKVKVFCLNSERFYAYVFAEDIKDLIDSITPLLDNTEKSGSTTWQDKNLQDFMKSYKINFTIYKMPTEVDLANIQRDIYLRCLK